MNGPKKTRFKIYLVGDSLTQQAWGRHGWASCLSEAYQRKADIVNRGFSGYNTRWMMAAWSVIQSSWDRRPDLITIWLGANDAVLKDGSSPKQYVPLHEYERNLENMVRSVRDLGQGDVSTPIVLLTPPPVSERLRKERFSAPPYEGNDPVPDRTNENTGKYARCCVELGDRLNVPTLDLWTSFQKDTDWEKYLSDGLHLTASGQEKVYQELMGVIEKNYPEIMPERLPFDLPKHDEIDGDHVAQSFESYTRTNGCTDPGQSRPT